MPQQFGLPTETSQDRPCLHRLDFGPPKERGGELVQTADYRNEAGQEFTITASTAPGRDEALAAFTADLHARLEAAKDDGTFLYGMEEAAPAKDERRDDPGRGITVAMTLVSPQPTDDTVCAFYIDPPITPGGSPHRYRPDGDAVRARIYVRRGSARLRFFRGNDPTDRRDDETAGHYTDWLAAPVTTPRAHVRALTAEAGYDIEGSWKRIPS